MMKHLFQVFSFITGTGVDKLPARGAEAQRQGAVCGGYTGGGADT